LLRLRTRDAANNPIGCADFKKFQPEIPRVCQKSKLEKGLKPDGHAKVKIISSGPSATIPA
jgi:hypothetical protein